MGGAIEDEWARSARQALGSRRHAGPAPLARAEPRLRDEPLRVAGSLRPAQQRLPVAHRRGPAHGAGAVDDVAARLDAQEAVPVVEAVPDDVDERHRRHLVPEHHGSSARGARRTVGGAGRIRRQARRPRSTATTDSSGGERRSARLAWWQPDASDAEDWRRQEARRSEVGRRTVTPDAIAAAVKAKHVAGTLSLVICNTVDMAREVFRALSSIDHKVLLTSRFRREDRARHEQRLLDFDAKRKAWQAAEGRSWPHLREHAGHRSRRGHLGASPLDRARAVAVDAATTGASEPKGRRPRGSGLGLGDAEGRRQQEGRAHRALRSRRHRAREEARRRVRAALAGRSRSRRPSPS